MNNLFFANNSINENFNQTLLKGNIVIIDALSDNLYFLSLILEDKGHLVREFTEGLLALKNIQTSIPDLIMVDINMPKIDGLNLCKILKSEPITRQIPVIFMSASNHLSDREQAFAVGGVDYIFKPFLPVEVLTRVETHLSLQFLQKKFNK